MNMAAQLLKLSHHLRHHRWFGAPLDRWTIVIVVVIALLMAVRLLPGGVPGIVACGLLLVALLLVQRWAARRNYVVFTAEPPPTHHSPAAPTMEPADKLLLRATGIFEVQKKVQRFTELLAYFRSFETREHVVMAIVPPSTYLRIGKWPEDEIGMWYIFFKNQEIQRIDVGQLSYGANRRPALRLALEQEILPETSPLEVWGGYPTGKPKIKLRRQAIYLSFDNEADRQKVLLDLVADAAKLGGGELRATQGLLPVALWVYNAAIGIAACVSISVRT